MTPQERDLITHLLSRLSQAGGQPKDPEADALIRQAVSEQPDMPYYLVQTVLIQDLSLHTAQNRMADLEKQLDDAHNVMQQAQKELKDKAEQHQRELDTKLQIAKMEIDSKERISAMDREAKITVAELGAKIDRLTLFMEERGRIGAQLVDHTHDATMNVLDHEQDLEKTQLGHQQALEAGAQGHQNALEQAAQPPPPDPNTPPESAGQ